MPKHYVFDGLIMIISKKPKLFRNFTGFTVGEFDDINNRLEKSMMIMRGDVEREDHKGLQVVVSSLNCL